MRYSKGHFEPGTQVGYRTLHTVAPPLNRGKDDENRPVIDNTKCNTKQNEQNHNESPPKRIKMMHAIHGPKTCGDTPSKSREFGEELDANNLDPMNSSVLSMESKDTAFSSLTMEDHNSTVGSDSGGADASSVAMLRGWLDNFGKQQKAHYQKNSSVPEKSALDIPARPKTQKPSPLPPAATPLPPAAASALVKKLVGPKKSIVASGRGEKPIPAIRRTTPVRFQPRINQEEVQATNEGYASVAKLSAWLADDPTRNRPKVQQLRRGANVIAKSRTFDKGLANVIIDETALRTGHVTRKKEQWKEQGIATAVSKDEDEEMKDTIDASSSSTSSSNAAARPVQNQDSSSNISVNDKKMWLANAFKKQEGSAMPVKAKTDVITAQDEREAMTARAKELWRTKHTSNASSAASSTSLPGAVRGSASQNRVASGRSMSTQRARVEEDKTSLDFQAARSLLVERAKSNGNAVDIMTKVKLRKAKFEKMEKEARRRSSSHGLLKTSWEQAGAAAGEEVREELPRDAYVKKYISDVAPKKTFDQLP